MEAVKTYLYTDETLAGPVVYEYFAFHKDERNYIDMIMVTAYFPSGDNLLITGHFFVDNALNISDDLRQKLLSHAT